MFTFYHLFSLVAIPFMFVDSTNIVSNRKKTKIVLKCSLDRVTFVITSVYQFVLTAKVTKRTKYGNAVRNMTVDNRSSAPNRLSEKRTTKI